MRYTANKQWFDKVCSKLLDKGKRAKVQWLRKPGQSNGDNMDNIRREGI
jgi:hypothetical protein